MSDTPTKQRQQGATALELLLVSPILLLVGLAIVQFALLFRAQLLVNYAAFEAARVGATEHAQSAPMMNALSLRLGPLLETPKSFAAGIPPTVVASASIHPQLLRFTHLERLNPDADVFSDWARTLPHLGVSAIPNSHLLHRADALRPGRASGLNLLDANLLQIRVTYGVKMQVPIIANLLAHTMEVVDAEHAYFYRHRRFPLQSTVTLRMQSPGWEGWDTIGAPVTTWTEGSADVIDTGGGCVDDEASYGAQTDHTKARRPHDRECDSNVITIIELFQLIGNEDHITQINC